MDETVEVAELGGNASVDFSILGMFANADLVVQTVMLLLVAASVWSWAIIFNTASRLRRARNRADGFEDLFWSGQSLDDLYGELRAAPGHPLAAVFVAAMREWKRSVGGSKGRSLDKLSIKDRILRVMMVTQAREMGHMEGQVGILATIGSAAPFVGLFGTVWGIMNSFKSIAMASDTSLATVAPGIAEALLATALGLVAAIPAVVAYNKLSGDLDRYAGRLEGFSDEFAALISRQMDDREAA
ncbi:protein TolQ [Yunchengibacter salinarum]|uniref:protein TolQ n=1 Tax=Yunchengibacter salinarum TaxID=3133399 RepID=UPI0035B57C12